MSMTNSSITATQVTRPTQRLKSTDEKIEELKQHFAENAIKMDFMRKSDGYFYVLGRIGLTENDSDWRIWKTIDASKQKNVEYLFKSNNKEDANNKFNEIIK